MQQELSAQIQVRTTADRREWLKQKAQSEDRSVNWLINKILEKAKAEDAERKPS